MDITSSRDFENKADSIKPSFLKFLGSARLAFSLIGLSIIAVAWHSFLEMQESDNSFSWRFVSLGLTIPLFLNILVSAINRFPFQKHHFSFLAAHLGLLLIIMGSWVPMLFELEGTVLLSKGSLENQAVKKFPYRLELQEVRLLDQPQPLSYGIDLYLGDNSQMVRLSPQTTSITYRGYRLSLDDLLLDRQGVPQAVKIVFHYTLLEDLLMYGGGLLLVLGTATLCLQRLSRRQRS
jgi:hypothetical protein